MNSHAFDYAREKYSRYDVDVENAITQVMETSLSIHCWQGDDVSGFENIQKGRSGGGILATGSYPGKARDIQELRSDLECVLKLVPGKHKISLHAMYGDFKDNSVDRDEVDYKYFDSWVKWAKTNELGLDLNSTLFAHPKADSGFTLSSKNEETRDFWIEHVKKCRKISAEIGKQLGVPCVHNIWIPDGMKDYTVDKAGYRKILVDSLDEIFAQKYPREHMIDSLESKLFGLGSESYVVGSHDFYLGYSVKNGLMPCIDLGHYHLSESVADKISSTLLFVPEVMLHVSRGVRWDSDHVVTIEDSVVNLFQEIVRGDFLNRVHIGLDYFDASINRIGAWAIGTRATQKALLLALLEPLGVLKHAEEKGDYFKRLALLEEMKSMPWGIIWERLCERAGVVTDASLVDAVLAYEKTLKKRVQ
jgi:L-rhamnose isomerase